VIRELLRVLGRHKALTAVLAVLCLAAAAATFLLVPAQYESKSQILLVPPVTQTDKGPTNPFLEFNGAVFQTASVLALSVTDQASVDAVAAAGGSPTYLVAPSLGDNAGPVLIVTATGASPEKVRKTVDLVRVDMHATLEQLQRASGAPASTWISQVVLVDSTEATRLFQTPVRATLAVLAVGLLVSMGLILLAERRRRRRALKRNATAPVVGVPSDGSTPVNRHAG